MVFVESGLVIGAVAIVLESSAAREPCPQFRDICSLLALIMEFPKHLVCYFLLPTTFVRSKPDAVTRRQENVPPFRGWLLIVIIQLLLSANEVQTISWEFVSSVRSEFRPISTTEDPLTVKVYTSAENMGTTNVKRITS